MKNHTERYYNPRQGVLPVFFADCLNICDPVIVFDKIMGEIGIERYLKPASYSRLGRPGYSRVNMLKTVLFGFMDTGYVSLRELEDRCKVNVRYMYLMDYETPSYRAFSYFINEEINARIEDIFIAINKHIQELEGVLERLAFFCHIDESQFTRGRGHKKSKEQRYYEKLKEYTKKLWEYVVKIDTCGPDRNSFSKTDPDATFMRMKKDYMGNDQLLPAYNIQIAVADEYIAAVDVQQYRSDMDCFIPLMEKFKKMYGFYPKYPIADAGYGSFNNYIFCQENGMEKYMKFPMYNKETKDKKYRDNPFRAVNFQIDQDGNMLCPNHKKMIFSYRKPVKGNKYGRQEEYYTCEDCSGCPYAEQCKKTDKNRTVCINQELTAMHQEVLENLQSIHGALLRMNRSIQAEGTFGIMKYDRWYKRIVRRGLKSVKLELYLVSIGHNLYKFYNKQLKAQMAA